MKKTRRIEITAFRREVTVYSGDEGSKDANGPSTGAESWQSLDASDRPTIDLARICNATLDAAKVDKVGFPDKAVREGPDHRSIAVKKVGLKQRRGPDSPSRRRFWTCSVSAAT